ncbi:hypothetical protein [Alkalimonas mucilaginosa]|uniref:Lipoprotein n=1 Tax=Alkalimonas mucilaginosa TaxID=3057676 RepID=A0ABU7JIS2_9GAMM|nr:hypothetical protein [Alkalimonas sp. MEB004]MEE2024863.1 hypothetical protein [Alkalimonas sp. MEB004]
MDKIVLIIVFSMLLIGCSSTRHNITFKNYSDEQIYVEYGMWGEWLVRGGYIVGLSEENLFPPGRTHASMPGPIPESITVVWKNSDDELIKESVDILRSDVPSVRRNEWYQFVITLTQFKIHQVEVIIHSSENIRSKKIKSMIYCSEGEGSCEFLTPFTTDTYYDPETLTEAQKARLERQKEITDNFRDELKEDVEEIRRRNGL